mmetsp:Transcript_46801/g.150391  ORF Transcript_46801/g.150391 Transcript_46801/m.150391 type:complete len:170 (+) Transcript_46801:65-574(+)
MVQAPASPPAPHPSSPSSSSSAPGAGAGPPKRRPPLALDQDRDFGNFVGRMVNGSRREHFSDEQLSFASSAPARRRVRTVLQTCRNKQGMLDMTCFTREACTEQVQSLASCLHDGGSEAAALASGETMCKKECDALSRCVKDEWRKFLTGISPGFRGDHLSPFEEPLAF